MQESIPALTPPPRRPPGRPRPEDLALLHDRLLTIGCDLFFRHGYGATTMHDVAQGARVSKTTLYSRFPSKAALFEAIIAARIEAQRRNLNLISQANFETLDALLFAYGEMVLRVGTLPENMELSRLIYGESGRFPELRLAAETHFRVGKDKLQQWLSSFAARDGIPCRDPEGASEMFIAATAGWISRMVVTGKLVSDQDRRDWLQRVVPAFLAGRPNW